MADTSTPLTMDTIVSLCRRRGFVFPSSEIYGGIGSTYDYGHYGVLVKNNIRSLWLRSMVQERDDIVVLDSAIILNPRVWEVSGHVAGFTDPMVDCTMCNFLFRLREFEQMEMEFFVPPAEADEWYRYWVDARRNWYLNLGLRDENLRVREHAAEELSHYSSGTSDLEYLYPIGWQELEGVANRGDYDLTQHTRESGTKLEWVEQDGTRYTPHVVEPAVSIDRIMLAFLCDPYDEAVVGDRERVVLHLHPLVAPVKAAILPLIAKDEGMATRARALYEELRRFHVVEHDEGGQIGRRYRRQDEIGTPWAFTVDEQTLEDETVTVRDRDSLAQERLPISR